MTDRAAKIAQHLRESLPSGLIRLLELIAAESSQPIYVVGGFVRDFLLGLNTAAQADLDLASEGDAISLSTALQANYGGSLQTYAPFRTATWAIDQAAQDKLEIQLSKTLTLIDFVTARRESYPTPGSLPIVEPSTIEDDLYRRDFTINAMAIQLKPLGILLDRFGGEHDLQEGLIRVLHDQSFIDDGTRLFRAIRFEQRFSFKIEPHTESLIPSALPYLRNISGERLRHEIDLIFREAEPEESLSRLAELGILTAIHPKLTFDKWTYNVFRTARREFPPHGWPTFDATGGLLSNVYWILLTCRLPDPTPILTRLQVTTDVIALVTAAQTHYRELATLDLPLPPSAIRRMLGDVPMLALYALWILAPAGRSKQQVETFAKVGQFVKRELTGDDLIALGLKPGRRFGTLLAELQRLRDDGEITTVEQERETVKKWLAEGFGL